MTRLPEDASTAQGWAFRLVDSLEKVFADEPPRTMNAGIPHSVFLGETLSFQIAFRAPHDAEKMDTAVRFSVEGELEELVRIATVELVPCEFVARTGHDDGYLRDTPGLYPDLLRPAPDGVVPPIIGGWRAAWFDLTVEAPELAGDRLITVEATRATTGAPLFSASVPVRIIPRRLPDLDIVNTHWLHADSLADYYGVEVYSEQHWLAIESFIASAARMRVNSLLVPVWTPPIDTEIGCRRRSVQLVGIARNRGNYTFDFDHLDRWLTICADHGITHLEIPHLFTQWGARAAPAIDGTVDGQPQQLFGWQTPATDRAYREFLELFLPALRGHLAERWDPSAVIYHVSDEPRPEDEDGYRAARAVVSDLLDGCVVVDALSDFVYYESGLVPHPVVATDRVGPFLASGMERIWVYFCLTQDRTVANRFIGMPLSRLRVLGSQLFAADAGGFLHWGFNFYGSARSHHRIDPFKDASAGGTMPAGDPFIVYPGPDFTAWESIRHRIATQAMDDHRALQLLGSAVGRSEAIKVIDPDGTLRFDVFPLDPDHYRSVRERLNRAIESF